MPPSISQVPCEPLPSSGCSCQPGFQADQVEGLTIVQWHAKRSCVPFHTTFFQADTFASSHLRRRTPRTSTLQVPREPLSSAVHWLTQAASQDFELPMFKGSGLGSNQGVMEASHLLGDLYCKGIGMPKPNPKEAVKWYTRAGELCWYGCVWPLSPSPVSCLLPPSGNICGNHGVTATIGVLSGKVEDLCCI